MANNPPTISGLLEAALDPRERQAVRQFFGFDTERHSPEEIGRNMPRETMGSDGTFVGLSGKRIQDILTRALRKLRNMEHSQTLKALIENGPASSPVMDLAREVLRSEEFAGTDTPSPQHVPKRSANHPHSRKKGQVIVMQPRG